MGNRTRALLLVSLGLWATGCSHDLEDQSKACGSSCDSGGLNTDLGLDGPEPDSSATPDTGATPDKGLTPDTGTTPDISVTPDQAATPDKSATPDQATTPDKSITPDKATTPDKSITPDQTTTPDKSITPDQGLCTVGKPCDDGKACTYNDTCLTGNVCKGTPYTCPAAPAAVTACATNACNGTGPAPSGCTLKVQSGFCALSTGCKAKGVLSPSCWACDPAYSTRILAPAPGCVGPLAGQASKGYLDGDARSKAKFNQPMGMAHDGKGGLYVADSFNHVIRYIKDDEVSTFAGVQSASGGYQDGNASQAKFNEPKDVHLAANGDLYVADHANHRIRKISNGVVSTVSGSAMGYQEGLVKNALFYKPTGVFMDSAGSILYVADTYNHQLRFITLGSTYHLAGYISGLGKPGSGYVNGNAIGQAKFYFPERIIDAGGGVQYVAEWGNHTIRKIEKGQVTTVVGNGVKGFSTGPATTAHLNSPGDLALSPDGKTLYIIDSWNHALRAVDITSSTPTLTTLAGDLNTPGYYDGTFAVARFNLPRGIEVDKNGYIYVSELNTYRLRVIKPN